MVSARSIGPVENPDEGKLNAIAGALLGGRPVFEFGVFNDDLSMSVAVPVNAELLTDLAPPIREAIADVLRRFARGEGVIIGSTDSLLTTGQAADLIGISRTYLVQKVDAGELKCRYVGTHRRISVKEAMRFRDVLRTRRREALDEVAEVSREAGLYDDDEF